MERYWQVGSFQSQVAFLYFVAGEGGFFPPVVSEPEKYVYKCDPKLREWVKKLKAAGKTLFLMTSSYVDFATFIMDFIYG